MMYRRRKQFPKTDRPRPVRKKPQKTHIKPGADAGLKKVFAAIGVPRSRPFSPDRFQLDALTAVARNDCLVTAPTGAGKTWIAEQAIAEIRNRDGRSWYACPLKALSNAKYAEFSAIFGPEHVGILTGDRRENPDAPIIVGTTEILRNQLYDAMHRGESLSTDFVVLDEAHFLGDEDRGVVWEEIMIYLPARIPLLLLSATIGNAGQISSWLASIRSRPCTVVEETVRPVKLFPLFFHPSGTLLPLTEPEKSGTRLKLNKKVGKFIKTKRPRGIGNRRQPPAFDGILRVLRKYDLLPAIFFLKSRADCDRALDACRDNQITDPGRKERLRKRMDDFIQRMPHLAGHRQRWQLEHLAVASHHSGQMPSWKLVLEQLMTEGLLDAVFATSTVAAGVNFPARTVAFLNSDRFNGKHFLPLTPTELQDRLCPADSRQIHGCPFDCETAVLPPFRCDQPDQNQLFDGIESAAVPQPGSDPRTLEKVICKLSAHKIKTQSRAARTVVARFFASSELPEKNRLRNGRQCPDGGRKVVIAIEGRSAALNRGRVPAGAFPADRSGSAGGNHCRLCQ